MMLRSRCCRVPILKSSSLMFSRLLLFYLASSPGETILALAQSMAIKLHANATVQAAENLARVYHSCCTFLTTYLEFWPVVISFIYRCLWYCFKSTFDIFRVLNFVTFRKKDHFIGPLSPDTHRNAKWETSMYSVNLLRKKYSGLTPLRAAVFDTVKVKLWHLPDTNSFVTIR